jgi:hypothetical protein
LGFGDRADGRRRPELREKGSVVARERARRPRVERSHVAERHAFGIRPERLMHDGQAVARVADDRRFTRGQAFP